MIGGRGRSREVDIIYIIITLEKINNRLDIDD